MKRLFRGLRDREPAPYYDAVVVGAGVGGLVCANLLAREGLRVLLLEQHYMVGGYCSTFRRGGFTFDAATHFYPLLGNPGTITGRLLRELGIATQWRKMDPVDAFHLPDRSRFEVPADLATYRRRLARRFPAEEPALEAFFAEVRDAYLRGMLCYFRGRDEAHLGPYRHATVRQVLDRHFTDPRLKLILSGDSPHWGSPPERTSFVFDAMLRLSYFLGNYYPAGGSQAFVDDLARRFEELGGDILMSTRAERILVRSDRVVGLQMETTRGRLAGSRQVSAGVMVSNADLQQTAEDLLGVDQVGTAYLDSLRRLRPSHPCFLTYLGLSSGQGQDLTELQGHYWRSWDPDSAARGGLRFKLFVPTAYEPAMAPAGGEIVILQKTQDLDYQNIEDWPTHKQAVEDEMIVDLARLIPDLDQRTVVRLSASAQTSWRFTLNHGGSMLGWEMSPSQLGTARPGVEGPVQGLYAVGHWTRPGGGITPVIVSAMRVADKIVARARRPQEVWSSHPGLVEDSTSEPAWIGAAR